MNNKDLMLDVRYNVEKIGFLLNEWINDYGFSEKPNPMAAMEWTQNVNQGRHQEQSAKWFWEYDRIYELIEIAMDYVGYTRELLEEAQENGK